MRYLSSRYSVSVACFLVCSAGLWGCATPGHPTSEQAVDRVVQPLNIAAPESPKACTDEKRPLPFAVSDARAILYLFSMDYCDACEREMRELDRHSDELEAAKVLVVHVVTDTAGSCLEAARVARRVPFPYSTVNADGEAQWRIRSTPTLYLVDPKTETVRLYIEGEMTTKEILEQVSAHVSPS